MPVIENGTLRDDEVAARQLELAGRAIERARDLAGQIEVVDLLVGDVRVADVEPAQVEAAGELRAGRVDVDVERRVDRRRLVVDDRGVREDRREPIELELRRFEIDRARSPSLGSSSPFAVHSWPGTPP